MEWSLLGLENKYNSKDITWGIGNFNEVGSQAGVEALNGLGTDNCPYSISSKNGQSSWNYHDGDKWRQPNNLKHIKIQCLTGKYTYLHYYGYNKTQFCTFLIASESRDP